ncbi:MAG: nuclear transport factor 2 family protein [Balneolaceae bacterium]
MLKLLILPTAIFFWIACEQPAPQAGVDDYWVEVSRTVSEGDFEGYSALYHEDAVMVNGITGRSYPIADALDGWQQGFEDTKADRMSAGVEFRFSEQLRGETTAHDTGIFRYSSREEGGGVQTSYIHFQGLLVKKDGRWIMMMEYQISEATVEEWDGLEP